jgi:hypothetical protein
MKRCAIIGTTQSLILLFCKEEGGWGIFVYAINIFITFRSTRIGMRVLSRCDETVRVHTLSWEHHGSEFQLWLAMCSREAFLGHAGHLKVELRTLGVTRLKFRCNLSRRQKPTKAETPKCGELQCWGVT